MQRLADGSKPKKKHSVSLKNARMLPLKSKILLHPVKNHRHLLYHFYTSSRKLPVSLRYTVAQTWWLHAASVRKRIDYLHAYRLGKPFWTGLVSKPGYHSFSDGWTLCTYTSVCHKNQRSQEAHEANSWHICQMNLMKEVHWEVRCMNWYGNVRWLHKWLMQNWKRRQQPFRLVAAGRWIQAVGK